MNNIKTKKMKATKFKEQNTVYTGDEYLELPALKGDGMVITCWKLTKEELEEINKTGVVWANQLIGEADLQPIVIGAIKDEFIK